MGVRPGHTEQIAADDRDLDLGQPRRGPLQITLLPCAPVGKVVVLVTSKPLRVNAVNGDLEMRPGLQRRSAQT